MYNDSFKIRYTVAPVAISEANRIIKGDTPPHLHNEIEILYIESGNAKVKINKNEFSVKKGDIVFVNPLEVHSVSVENEETYNHKCICFDSVLITDEKMRTDINNGFLKMPYILENDNAVKEVFFKFFSAVKDNNASLYFECSAYVSLIFAYFVKKHFLVRTVTSQTSNKFCEKVCEYLKKHYHEDVSSKDIAKDIGYTQSYFCRMFKKSFNVNFSEYLNMFRISESKKILENKNAKTADVAYECGFTSPVYFARCFKKYIGMTPSAYKKCQYKY